MNKNIEAEGDELVLRNEYGDIAIIPKNKRRRALNFLVADNNKGLDNIIDKLPTKGQYAEEGLIKTSTPSREQVIEANRPVMPSDEELLKSTLTSSGTVLPVLNNLKQEKYCGTNDCAAWATTDLANQLGVSRAKVEPKVAESAWFRRNKMIGEGGDLLWEEGKPMDYNLFQVGDQVLLANGWQSHYAKSDPDVRDGYAKIPLERHAGTIIGRNEGGVPIVRHNYTGRLYEEPINDIKLKRKYYPSSVVRMAGANEYTDSMKKQAIEQARREWIANNYDPNVTFTMADDEVGREIYDNYVKNRKAMALGYGMDPTRLDDIMMDLVGIAAQESNLDNTMPDDIKSKGKQFLANAIPGPLNTAAKGLEKTAGYITDALLEAVYPDVGISEEYIPNWKRQIMVDKLAKEKGLSQAAARDFITRKYGMQSNVKEITSKSYGPWKQKNPSETWRRNMISDYQASRKQWSKGWDWSDSKMLQNAVGLYLDNYKEMKKLYPNESEDFWRSGSIISWSAPSKARSKEYMDYYYRGIGNPRGGIDIDYLKKVKEYRDKYTK